MLTLLVIFIVGCLVVAGVIGKLASFMTPNVNTPEDREEERKNNPTGHLIRTILFPEDFAPPGTYEAKAAEQRAAMRENALRAEIFAARVRANWKN